MKRIKLTLGQVAHVCEAMDVETGRSIPNLMRVDIMVEANSITTARFTIVDPGLYPPAQHPGFMTAEEAADVWQFDGSAPVEGSSDGYPIFTLDRCPSIKWHTSIVIAGQP